MRTPFTFADKQLAKLKKSVSAEFQNAANRMLFDELNVVSAKEVTVELYNRLRATNERMFESIARQAYKAAFVEAKAEGDEPGLGVAFVQTLLNQYNALTLYVYNNEVRRKRERLTEALISAPNRQTARAALNRAAKLWFGQAREYADIAVTEARKQAFEDAGVERVRWIAEEDERTCHTCRELDRRVFKLYEAPELPQHYHCRCWLEPVID